MARENQRMPEIDWHTWLILAGRGFGKTRTGAESVRQLIENHGYRRIALIGSSIVQTRSIMVEGVSGILSTYLPSSQPHTAMSKREIHFKNGAVAMLFGGDQVDQLRGPQFDLAWVDELAKFRTPDKLMEQLALSLRLGIQPRCIITTTPRPLPILNKLITQEGVVVTRGTTFDNVANLAPTFMEQVVREFKGTKLGSQELYGEILNETQGALWQRSNVVYSEPLYDEHQRPLLSRIVVAIDPATTHHDGSDETGIIVAGVDDKGCGYVLEDLSGKHSPLDWGQRAVSAYHRYKADRIVAEVNKGGDLVERVIRSIDACASYKEVRATRGKAVRAEPVAALYEKGRIFHSRPLHLLEEQMCSYIPGSTSKSPDRVDALVWAFTDLLLVGEASAQLKIWGA
ncbi:MAG: terminase family protein [Alphaproteobacteria bacterium]|nr:terminase family protein [Alphaproteobacteria bacterium]